MQYLKEPTEIRTQIAKFALAQILWLDTKVADWQTSQPKLSLIQVLIEPRDLTGKFVYILDVLHQPDLVLYFINQIMINPKIEKIFHNASFDLKYLGGNSAQNVTCTLKIARRIGKDILKVSNLQLRSVEC